MTKQGWQRQAPMPRRRGAGLTVTRWLSVLLGICVAVDASVVVDCPNASVGTFSVVVAASVVVASDGGAWLSD